MIKGTLKILGFLLIAGLALAAGSQVKHLDSGTGQLLNLPSELIDSSLKEPLIILVAGVDAEYDNSKYGYSVKVKNTFHGRTDTLLIVKLDPKGKTISILNIPRDTRVLLNGKSASKINSLNPLLADPEKLKAMVGDLLNVKIDKYLLVSAEGVIKMLDAAGGVELTVPFKMKYKDKTDGLEINLEPGLQALNGRQTVGFLRYRQDKFGDIGRIQRQQLFLRALPQKLSDPKIYAQLPQLLSLSLEAIQSDLDAKQIFQIAEFARKQPELIQATLPGDFSMPEFEEVTVEETVEAPPSANGEKASSEETETVTKTVRVAKPFVSYWLIDQAQAKAVISRLFNSEGTSTSSTPKRLMIGIEYAGAKKDLSDLRKKLSACNASIIDLSQHSSTHEPVFTLYAQRGNAEQATELSECLELKAKSYKIQSANFGSPLADISLYLPENWQTEVKKPMKTTASPKPKMKATSNKKTSPKKTS